MATEAEGLKLHLLVVLYTRLGLQVRLPNTNFLAMVETSLVQAFIRTLWFLSSPRHKKVITKNVPKIAQIKAFTKVCIQNSLQCAQTVFDLSHEKINFSKMAQWIFFKF